MKTRVKALVLTGFGLNCDHETAYTFELAGAEAHRVHINALIDGSVQLADYHIMAFVGGFSWGDDHGAGVIQAVRMKTRLGDKLLDFIEAGKLIIGICNGFQTIVNIGLLPGLDSDYQQRSVALTYNDCGNFRDQWVHLNVNASSPCIFTKDLEHIMLPVRHGEGKFFAEAQVVSDLKNRHQIVMQYADASGAPAEGRFPENPNGSIMDIAGICDPTGRVFGLMPHPEAFHHPTHHPHWTRQKASVSRQGGVWGNPDTVGLNIFKNAVAYAMTV